MTTEELITTQFYDWEMRGRGWQVWDCPVELEPPFRAFSGYHIPAADDGRRPTALSSWVEKLHGRQRFPEPSRERPVLPESVGNEEPALYLDESPLIEIQLLQPVKANLSSELATRFLSSLRISAYPISFEIIGLADIILIQFACRQKDASLLRSNLRAYFPDSKFRETSGFLACNWQQQSNEEDCPVIVDFGLSHEFVIPLHCQGRSSIDSLIEIVGSMSDVQIGEAAVVQVLFHGTQYDWANSAIVATTDMAGNSVLANVPKMPECLREKLSQPLFASVFRVGAKSANQEGSWELAKRVGSALVSVFTVSGGADANELIPLSNDGYDEDRHEVDLLRRHTHRSGMILNAAEMVPLVHLPSPSVRSDKFEIERATRAAPPLALRSENEIAASVTLGANIHEGKTRQVALSDKLRSRHVHVIGSTGSGKSTLLLSLIKQDLEQNQGLCVIDPHGDLIDSVIENVPDNRIKDVVLFDPSDSEFPIGFNILQAKSVLEKNLLSSDLLATFRRMSTSWGDVMDSVLANAILAFIESTRGGTLFELKRFLVEKQFREEFLESVTDDGVVYFWENEFPLIAGKPQASILIRLNAFLRQSLIRNIVCQKENKLNFRWIMDNRKVLLVKLSQGLIGEENAYLLGTMLVSRLYQSALSRQDSHDRRYFWMYLDEFHHFITPSMERILSGTRKYNMGLILAHQEFRQMQSRSQEVASSVLSNCYTRVCFRLGDNDGEKFAGGFSFFDAKALQNLGIGEAIARIERAEYDFNLRTSPIASVPTDIANRRKVEIVHLSRDSYGRARSEVEEELRDLVQRPKKAEPKVRPKKVEDVPEPVEEKISPSRPTETKPVKPIEPVLSTEPVFIEPVDTPVSEKRTQQHRYLQTLVKKMAEDKGLRVTFEKPVLGGVGKIDVALENEIIKIACEISVTNEPDYELQNIQKCLAAGFTSVILICADERHLGRIRKTVQDALTPDEIKLVEFLTPEEFHLWLEKVPNEKNPPEERIKGYKIKTKINPVDEAQIKTRKKAISEVVFGALKRLRNKKDDK